MKQIRISLSIIKILWKDKVAYPGRLVADLAIIVARCGVLLLLYANVYRLKGGVINGTTYEVAAWSMFMYFAFMSLKLRYTGSTMENDIRTGNVELLLAKPINYLLYRSVWVFGASLYPFVITTVVGIAFMLFTVGPLPVMYSMYFYISLIGVFITCTVLSLLIFTIIGLLAFWMEDIKPIYAIIDKLVMMLGGSYLPIALFPAFLYQISIWSPFGASQFISHIVYDNWWDNYIKMFGIQFFWIFVLSLIVYVMFKRAERALTVNGG